ncbi:MAG TPA: hypothetical protein PLW44_17130, partial [Chitinophagales bacterium]|nr:hypothetical protein [Chitinophagales bacterium]
AITRVLNPIEAMPLLLFVVAATIPEQCVPWFQASPDVMPDGGLVLPSRSATSKPVRSSVYPFRSSSKPLLATSPVFTHRLLTRSSCVVDTALSTTATTMFC